MIYLPSLRSLLTRLKESGQEELLQVVLRDIEREDFHLIIESLAHNEENSSTVYNLVDLIIDDFYSHEEDVC